LVEHGERHRPAFGPGAIDLGAIDLGGLFVGAVASRDEPQTLAQTRRISTSAARIGCRFAEKSRV